jgi:hypothetical protein
MSQAEIFLAHPTRMQIYYFRVFVFLDLLVMCINIKIGLRQFIICFLPLDKLHIHGGRKCHDCVQRALVRVLDVCMLLIQIMISVFPLSIYIKKSVAGWKLTNCRAQQL